MKTLWLGRLGKAAYGQDLSICLGEGSQCDSNLQSGKGSWGNKLVTEITPYDVKNLLNKVAAGRGQVLFIDARKLGFMVDRARKEFSDADVARIAETYQAWRLGEGYADILGFCKSASRDEIRSHGHVLTPGRHMGAEAAEEDDVPFAERFAGLQEVLETQFAEAEALTTTIRARLAGVVGQFLGFSAAW